MTHTTVKAADVGAEMDFQLDTARGIDRLIAVSHHTQQKICATVLQCSLIERLLERPEPDVAMMRRLLAQIKAASYSAAEAVSELQGLTIEHFGDRDLAGAAAFGAARAA